MAFMNHRPVKLESDVYLNCAFGFQLMPKQRMEDNFNSRGTYGRYRSEIH